MRPEHCDGLRPQVLYMGELKVCGTFLCENKGTAQFASGKASGCTVAGTGGFAERDRFVLTRDARIKKVSTGAYPGKTYHRHIRDYAEENHWTPDQLANRLANTYDSKDNRWYIH